MKALMCSGIGGTFGRGPLICSPSLILLPSDFLFSEKYVITNTPPNRTINNTELSIFFTTLCYTNMYNSIVFILIFIMMLNVYAYLTLEGLYSKMSLCQGLSFGRSLLFLGYSTHNCKKGLGGPALGCWGVWGEEGRTYH